jgi:RNA-directed DNA polymerase
MPDRADGNCGIVRCRGEEAGGETSDLTNRNRIGGTSTWVSQHEVVSLSLPMGAACRYGRDRGTAVVLIRGGLSGCRRVGVCPAATAAAETLVSAWQESAEAVVPAGFLTCVCVGWEGPNVKAEEMNVVAGDGRMDRSQPACAGQSQVEMVNLSELVAGRSGRLASPESSSRPVRVDGVWEQVFSKTNLTRALRRVERNRGAPGVDGVTTDELRGWLVGHWAEVKEALDAGRYRPQPVRRVEIPKPDGGMRMLGVPTVLDRLIQQAMAQVLMPIFDPDFSEHSYGFRPGRSAHQAVEQARVWLGDGFRWVVDVDLDRFFDRVNHDKLMHRVAGRVADKRLLRLVRAYIEAGVMVDGVKQPVAEGTPQGSPLSPLLSNIMLDDLDRELERRGHRFVRYADDLRVFVRSERAARRILDGITGIVEGRLKLKVNREKSSITSAGKAALLGFGFYFLTGGVVKVRVHPKALKRVKMRLRQLTRRNWGVSMEHRIRKLNRFIAGWCAYFGYADNYSLFEELDKWLRRRLRQVRWKEWKRPKGRIRNLLALGVPEPLAFQWGFSSKGPWRIAGSAPLQRALPNSYWDDHGLRGFNHHWHRRHGA